MTLKEFWNDRVQNYYKGIFKYLQYVFNDHFLLFLFILFGALAYAYSQFVKSLTPEFSFLSVFAFIVSVFSLYIGELSLLLEPADQVFLTASENKVESVIKQSRLRSMIIPAVFLLALSQILMPLLVGLEILAFKDWFLFALILLFLKWAQLTLQIFDFKRYKTRAKQIYSVVFFLSSSLSIGSYLYFSKLLAVISAVSLLIIFEIILHFYSSKKRFDWPYMVESEQNRKKRIYQTLNLFTDVPFIKDAPSRKKWADGFIDRLQGENQSLSYYILIRSFVRSSDEGRLYLRLLLVGSIMILITDVVLFKGIIGLVFLALIALQMTGLSQSFEREAVHVVFGVRVDDAPTSLQKLLTYLIGSGSILFGLVSLFPYQGIQSMLPLVVFVIFTLIYIKFILPRRAKLKS